MTRIYALKTNPYRILWKALIGTGLTCAFNLIAPAQDSQESDGLEEDVFELSPFMVEPSSGWYVSETIIGTRLNASTKDLAQFIEGITAEFMEDFGLNSIEEAALYSVNLENSSDFVTGNGRDRSMRIRGLTRPTYARMTFESRIPSDSYNIDRYDIAYGPNPIFFGMGSPGGIINTDLKLAQFEDFLSVEDEIDSDGSHRVELHANQNIIDKRLAIRVDLLYKDEGFGTEPGGQLDRRFYTSIRYRPFKDTLFRAYYEAVDIQSNYPTRLYAYDQVTPWFQAAELPDSGYETNRPIFENSLDWYESDQGLEGQVFANAPNGPVYIIDSPGTTGINLASWDRSVVINPLQNWDHISPLNALSNECTFLDDKYYPDDISPVSADSEFQQKGHVLNLLYNQALLQNLHLEVGYHYEHLRKFNAGGIFGFGTIQVDANAYLPDNTTPNPNVGQYFVQGQPWRYSKGYWNNSDAAAALSYKHDFSDSEEDWLSWLGRHAFVGRVSSSFQEDNVGSFQYRITPEILQGGELQFPQIDGVEWAYPYLRDPDTNELLFNQHAGFMEQDNTRLFFRYYLDPDNGVYLPSMPFTAGQPLHLVDSVGQPFTIDPEKTGFVDADGRRLIMGGWSSNFRNRSDILQFSWMGHFLNDRLIFTYGWNRTRVDYARPVDESNDPYTGMARHYEDIPFGDWIESGKGDSEIKGMVLAPFRDWVELPFDADLILTAQKANTYQDNSGAYSPFGIPYPNAVGKSVDRGIQLSLFNERLVLRYNYYQNTANPTKAGNWVQKIKTRLGAIEERVLELDPAFPAIVGKNDLGFNPDNSVPYHLVSNMRSVGHEVAVNIRPVRNIELRVSASFSEVTEDNIGQDWWEWMDQRIEMYKALDVPEGGVLDPRDIDRDGEIGRWTWETARFNDKWKRTLAQQWDSKVMFGLYGREMIQAIEGRSNPFIRNLRLNVNLIYRINKGWLRGSRIGGAFRWREEPLLSYGAKEVDGLQVLDLEQPFYGEKEYTLDLSFRYKPRLHWALKRNVMISLNIRNVLDRDDPIPVEMDIHGQPVVMARVDGIQYILGVSIDLW